MAIGGFNGTDPSPTLAEFEQWVAAGKIHYFIPAATARPGRRRDGRRLGTASPDHAWVEANYTATTIGGTTVYDLTPPGDIDDLHSQTSALRVSTTICSSSPSAIDCRPRG